MKPLKLDEYHGAVVAHMKQPLNKRRAEWWLRLGELLDAWGLASYRAAETERQGLPWQIRLMRWAFFWWCCLMAVLLISGGW